MIAYAYMRVSGAGQIEGDGPERQFRAIESFATLHNLPLSENTFFEKGVSGTVEAMDRPAFVEMVAACQPGDCVIIERMDRLARDLMVQELLLNECRKRQIKVFAVDQGALLDQADTGADPTRKLIRQVLGAVAEWEKTALVLKLRGARMRKRAATGKCEGGPVYGEMPGEKAIKDMVMELHSAEYGYGEIAQVLVAGGFKNRLGRPFSKDTVRNMITQRHVSLKPKEDNHEVA